MPLITLPDGSQRSYEKAVTVAEVAASIGAGLARAALAGKVDGQLVDTSYLISSDSALSIITDKDADGLDIIRHSASHLMAYAVKELFPEAQVTIGPVIENGFYYDFSYARPFTPEDLVAIEKRMAELAKKDIPVTRKVMPRDDAVAYFKGIGELYKAEIIASIPADQAVSLYTEGDFTDLCRGPHVPSTGMSGTASMARRYVEAIAGTHAAVFDTRKTTPGLRLLEKHAVAAGGARNHRIGLFDQVLIKDNHIALMPPGPLGSGPAEAVRRCRAELGADTVIEVEIERLDDLEPVIAAGADIVLLDNMTPALLAQGVAIRNRIRNRTVKPGARRVELEASGGITLATIRAVAETGVERISTGALTHSVQALDLSLRTSPRH